MEITLVPHGDATILRLRHTDLPSDLAREQHRQGWTHYLGRLATAGAGGDPGPDPLAG
ncbi:MAG: SRPBCC domain-containing protein [Actinomycetota bacterium]